MITLVTTANNSSIIRPKAYEVETSSLFRLKNILKEKFQYTSTKHLKYKICRTTNNSEFSEIKVYIPFADERKYFSEEIESIRALDNILEDDMLLIPYSDSFIPFEFARDYVVRYKDNIQRILTENRNTISSLSKSSIQLRNHIKDYDLIEICRTASLNEQAIEAKRLISRLEEIKTLAIKELKDSNTILEEKRKEARKHIQSIAINVLKLHQQ